MSNTSKLNDFVNSVNDIVSPNLAGASAGILGATNTDSAVLINLKKITSEFAREYNTTNPDATKLDNLSAQISGCLLTLNVMNVIDEQMIGLLIDQLNSLNKQ